MKDQSEKSRLGVLWERAWRWILRKSKFVRHLEADLFRIDRNFRDYVTGKATLEDIAIENGHLTITAATELTCVMAAQFLTLIEIVRVATERNREMQQYGLVYVEQDIYLPPRKFVCISDQR